MKRNPIGRGWARPQEVENKKQDRSFAKACAKIQESLDKFNFADEFSDDDSEEEQEKDKVLEKVLHSYQRENEGGNEGHFERTQDFLVELLTAGGIVCLICIETVKKVDAIWSCNSCYDIFHLACIQKWATDSIQYQQLSEIKAPRIHWCCPKCRYEYAVAEKPVSYFCFCKKIKDPTFDPWLIPHSCGQICNKGLRTCSHSCLLLCHPGPCPPCARTVQSSCYCGKQKPTVRRCSKKEWSCGQKCRKSLNCRQHQCNNLCHEGECLPCQKESEQKCCCGRESCLRPCNDPDWQCKQVCSKTLPCGHHNCMKICHSGLCESCPQVRNCPCGKTKLNISCQEDILLCGDTCEKLLECKIHHCAQRCHSGPCSPCLQVRIQSCRCGGKEKSFPCSKEFICETKCKKLRNCKKHACNRKCCEGNCPPCEQLCGRTLPCKNHKCSSQCHQGPCYPCPLRATVSCNCQKTKVSVPCGREKVTKPPKCREPCRIEPDCHHPMRSPHNCHFGPCPACIQICDQLLQPCLHSCKSKCHDKVKIQEQHKRAGPWEPMPLIRIECLPCPPCQIPMPLQCEGKHTVHDFACSELKPWSCGRPCGVALSCGNHTCQEECHSGDSHPSCDSACLKPRPPGCSHACPLPCHPEPECPPCNIIMRKQCHCNLNKLYISCSKLTNQEDIDTDALFNCQNRCPKLLVCGHRCPLICHPGECASTEACKKKVTLRCPCKRLKVEFPCKRLEIEFPGSLKKEIECDDECKRLLQEALLLNSKKIEEPVEEVKLIEPKKRKQRNRRNRNCNEEEEKEKGPWTKIIVVSLLILIFAAFTSYLVFK